MAKLTNQQVAALWARQKHGPRDRATSGNQSLYFIGPVIYSYGPHWPLAIILPAIASRDPETRVALVNGARYGVTTSKHASLVAGEFHARNVPSASVAVPNFQPLAEALARIMADRDDPANLGKRICNEISNHVQRFGSSEDTSDKRKRELQAIADTLRRHIYLPEDCH